jgi:hypothetical protein
MKKRVLLVCGITGIMAAGCSRRMATSPSSGAPAPALAVAPETAVPLPAKTPFDGDPKVRAVYLENYATGYRLATADYASPGCLCAAEGDEERYHAAWEGFFDGREAGAAAVNKGRPGRPAPPAAAPATPAVAPPVQPTDRST